MCFRRAPAGGDDGIAIGGGAEGAARWDIFRHKITGIVRASAIGQRGQATINRRAAAWRKGVGYTFCQAATDSLQDWRRGREICWRKPKNIIVLVWFEQCCAARRAGSKNPAT